jgi:hypothetical protein
VRDILSSTDLDVDARADAWPGLTALTAAANMGKEGVVEVLLQEVTEALG